MPKKDSIKVRSFGIKTILGAISSIQCTLSNGLKSPVFEKADIEHSNFRTLDFRVDKKIASVQADDFRGSDYVHRIWFYDKANRKLQLQNPTGKRESGTTFKIGEDEELIGVYGVKD